MKKAYVNLPDSELYASQYMIKIEYQDGEVFEKEITNYSISNVFDLIKENHQDEYDRPINSIKIDVIK
jgi:hypothetical protein